MLSKDLIFRKKEERSLCEHSSGAILLVRHAESGFTPFFTPLSPIPPTGRTGWSGRHYMLNSPSNVSRTFTIIYDVL